VQHEPCILAVDDDATTRAFLAGTLAPLPVRLHLAASCREFGELLERVAPSLCLLDVDLPDGDGFALAELLRRRPGTPAVFLTVHGDDARKLRALELGAVEYLAKPVHPRELLLRVANLLATLGRRGGEAGPAPRPAPGPGGLRLDPPRRRLLDAGGEDLGLTAAEFDVLALLASRPRTVVSRQEIAQRLGPRSAARHNARIVDILIWRLRKKLRHRFQRDRFVVTVPSRGYMLAEEIAPGPEA
jgi:two-component system, OmpR family, response regulator